MANQHVPISKATRRTAAVCLRPAAAAGGAVQRKAAGSIGLAWDAHSRIVGVLVHELVGKVSRSSSAEAAASARSGGAVASIACLGPMRSLSAPSEKGPTRPETITAVSTEAKAPVREPSEAEVTSAQIAQLMARKSQSEPHRPHAVCTARRAGNVGLRAQPTASTHMPRMHSTKMHFRPRRSAAKVSAGKASKDGRLAKLLTASRKKEASSTAARLPHGAAPGCAHESARTCDGTRMS